MKRTLSLDRSPSSRSLKRANTSLFSIATIVEDQDLVDGNVLAERRTFASSVASSLSLLPLDSEAGDQTEGAEGGDKSISVGKSPPFLRAVSASTSPPSTPINSVTETDVDASSLDGFYIDDADDSEGEDDGCIVTSSTTSGSFLSTSAAVSVSDSNQNGVGVLSSGPSTAPVIAKEVSVEPTTEVIDSPIKPKESKDLRTGVVFESGDNHFDRSNRFHKERPLRVTSVRDHLAGSEENLSDRCSIFGDAENMEKSGPEWEWLNDDDYLRVHLPGYMQRLDRLSNCNCCDRLDREAEQFKSIYFTPDSVREAKTAAASLCRLVSNVVTDKLDNGFAVIRPPGHHAEPGLAGGYCIVNNVAVAAAYAREKLGVKRILIVDWDVHHGNGTQSIFLNDPDVLYFSVHRYHGGNFFPFLQNGGPTTVGMGEGTGFNVNVGWSRKGMGDEEYLAVWEKVLLPIANEFKPDLVLVSAGFDAAKGDMGECNVTPECFARLTRSLMTLADGKVVCALEGGYVRSVLGKCVESVVRTLLDRKSAADGEREWAEDRSERGDEDVLNCINSSAAKNIRDTIAAHRTYWSCFGEQKAE